MERLTWHNGEYWTQRQDVDVGYKDICARLAAYEDTGLTPERVKDMAENVETCLLTWFEARYGFPVGTLMDILEAKQEGRLKVSPVNVGETVWDRDAEPWVVVSVSWFSGDVAYLRCVSPVNGGRRTLVLGKRSVGSVVFLTREAAVAAMVTVAKNATVVEERTVDKLSPADRQLYNDVMESLKGEGDG